MTIALFVRGYANETVDPERERRGPPEDLG